MRANYIAQRFLPAGMPALPLPATSLKDSRGFRALRGDPIRQQIRRFPLQHACTGALASLPAQDSTFTQRHDPSSPGDEKENTGLFNEPLLVALPPVRAKPLETLAQCQGICSTWLSTDCSTTIREELGTSQVQSICPARGVVSRHPYGQCLHRLPHQHPMPKPDETDTHQHHKPER